MWSFLVVLLLMSLAPVDSGFRFKFRKPSVRRNSLGSLSKPFSEALTKLQRNLKRQMAELPSLSNLKRYEFPQSKINNYEAFSKSFFKEIETYNLRPKVRAPPNHPELAAEVNNIIQSIRSGKADPKLVLLTAERGKPGMDWIKWNSGTSNSAPFTVFKKVKPVKPEAKMAPKNKAGTDVAAPKSIADADVGAAKSKAGTDVAAAKSKADADVAAAKSKADADVAAAKSKVETTDLAASKSKPETDVAALKSKAESDLTARKLERGEIEVQKSSSKVKPRKPGVESGVPSKTKKVLKKKLKKTLKKELKKCLKKVAKTVFKFSDKKTNMTSVSEEQRYQRILTKALKKCMKESEVTTTTMPTTTTTTTTTTTETTTMQSKTEAHYSTTNYVTREGRPALRTAAAVEPQLPASRSFLGVGIFGGLLVFAIVWIAVYTWRKKPGRMAPIVTEEEPLRNFPTHCGKKYPVPTSDV